MHVPGGGTTYNRVHIFMSLYVCVRARARQYQEVFNDFHVGSVFMLKTDAFYG
jgi:hypothetical protein